MIRSRSGFTLIEMLAAMAILGTLATIAIPRVQDAVNRAKVARAIGDISAIQSEITGYMSNGDSLPPSLATIGRAGMLDPWGRPYVYYPFPSNGGLGSARKDRFLVPLNSLYDLYSKGKDGQSASALTAAVSHDDVIRANDGGYIGLASAF